VFFTRDRQKGTHDHPISPVWTGCRCLRSPGTFSRADVAFSDLSATAPYYFHPIGYAVVGDGQTMGAQFTSGLTGGITSVTLGLEVLNIFPGNDGNVNVYFEPVPSSPGLVDLSTATLLGTATTTTDYFTSDSSQLTSVNLLAPGLITLTANQQYYLIVQPGDSNTFVSWASNNTGATGNVFISPDFGATFAPFPTNTFPAFQIETAAVPEPSSLFLGALGAIGAGILSLRRKRNAI